MRSFSLALLALLGLHGSPASASDADVVKQFGMLGRIAVDCSAPHSRDNPHLIYTASPQGKVTRTLKMVPDLDGTFVMRNLRLLTPTLMQYNEISRGSDMTITVAKIDGKFRSWHSMQADGTVLIADGKFPKTGAPTIAFTFCGR
jgi:hypothetical protein